ncbi:MAG: hypothetical protein Q4D53_05395 [Leptotrichiaceae bacterium]|nr:hypothetical protein [Leptotrichiaceae bacterium]
MKSKRGGFRRGAGRPVGTTKEITKNMTFLGVKVTEEEKKKLNCNLQKYMKLHSLNKSAAIRKIFTEL